MTMPPEITPQQRDVLYGSITARLSGVGDVLTEFELGNFEAAHRLSGEFSDDLRVLHDDLGWGVCPLTSISLSAPRDVWERTLTRVKRRARADLRRHIERAEELDEERRGIQALEDTCAALEEEFSRSS